MDAQLKRCLEVFPEEKYYDPMVKALEQQRMLYTANLGIDMGLDWFGDKGAAFRAKSLHYYVRKYTQATLIRAFRQAASQVRGMIHLADQKSGLTSLDPIVMDEVKPEETTKAVEKVPAIFMENMREQAKARREKARRISRRTTA